MRFPYSCICRKNFLIRQKRQIRQIQLYGNQVLRMTALCNSRYRNLKGYSSDQSHFSEINVKLAEKNKCATHSVQRSYEMCEKK